MKLTATCALGLEDFLADELRALDAEAIAAERGAVRFRGTWRDVYRANWRLRTANRVLVELASWDAPSDAALARGAEKLVAANGRWDGLSPAELFHPDHTFAIRATTSASRIRDIRWVGLKVKDGLVDGQRQRFKRRASVDRLSPDLSLRVRLHKDRATLLLDTSGDSLDHRGYRVATVKAPVREQLAAACVLAAGWDDDETDEQSGWNRQGPIVDPMCGSGTLLAEAASLALGRAPGYLRVDDHGTLHHAGTGWAFERLSNFDASLFSSVRQEELPTPNPDVQLRGVDRDGRTIQAARANLERARLLGRTVLERASAFAWTPPPGPGLLLVNPPYGERLAADDIASWKQLGDLLKHHYAGWRAIVLAGGEGRGKHLGLRPTCRYPVKNGPLDARILVVDLY